MDVGLIRQQQRQPVRQQQYYRGLRCARLWWGSYAVLLSAATNLPRAQVQDLV